MNSQSKIGGKLKEARLRKKLIQAQVAKAAGISVNYYARVERDEETPSIPVLQKILKILDIKSVEIQP